MDEYHIDVIISIRGRNLGTDRLRYYLVTTLPEVLDDGLPNPKYSNTRFHDLLIYLK